MSRRITVPEDIKDKLSPWYSRDLLDAAPVLQGSFFGWLFGRFNQHAVTINKTIHLTSAAPDLESISGTVLLGHECFHIEQQQEMGWGKFLARYVSSWRPSHLKSGRNHPMERPAYDRSREIRNALT